MRGALVSTLIEMAAADDRIMFLTGDLGWSVVEPFARRFPRRFLNVGVAEANMAGIAAGLALEGFIPFMYSIATFSSMRPYEQVRNGAVLHRLPVRVVGVGGGFAYGHAGPTHHALEDLAIMRTQVGMTTIAPADPGQTRAALLASRRIPGPVYFRVGKGGNAMVPGLRGRFALGRPEIVRKGGGTLLLATGAAAVTAVEAAGMLGAAGKPPAVAVMAHLPSEDSGPLASLLRRFRRVVTVEEAYVAGGLGSLAAETIARGGLRTRLSVVGVRSRADGLAGGEKWLRRRHGIDAAAVAAAVRKLS